MPASHQTAERSPAAASRGRRTQHRAHPRRRRRRARRRPGGEHGRDRPPRGGRARDHLRALPDPRSAARSGHRARARRRRPPSSPRPSPSAATPRRRWRGSSPPTWRTLGRYHALVAINTSSADARAAPPPPWLRARQLLPLIERGQAEGAFRTDVPAGWHLAMLMALIHAGSAELRAGRVPRPSRGGVGRDRARRGPCSPPRRAGHHGVTSL